MVFVSSVFLKKISVKALKNQKILIYFPLIILI